MNLLFGNRGNHKIIGFLIFLILICSCDETILDIDLSEFERNIVIEAVISDRTGPYTVKISRIENFFEEEVTLLVTGAEINVYDDEGNTETLTEVNAGMYRGSKIRGVPGRRYKLEVQYKGEEYIAYSTMPEPMTLKSIVTEKVESNNYKLLFFISDILDVDEYCKLKIFRNGQFQRDILYYDKLSEGDEVVIDETGFTRFDQVEIELVTFTKEIFEYFSSLKELEDSDDSELLELTGGNPKSNISNNALGYFSAQTYRKYTKIIQ
ncbi:DUF4249 domain-containing protein [Bacteroidota bacterium]